MRTFHFDRTKYGPELLVDVGRIERLKGYGLARGPHRLTFYELLLVTDGAGTFSLDGDPVAIRPGAVVVTCPHQVRAWALDRPARGYSFFFEGAFLNAFFLDPVFVNRFALFDYARPAPGFHIEDADALRKMRFALGEAEAEMRALQGDSPHLLRALLYYAIGLFDRLYRAQHGLAQADAHPLVYRFKQLLDERVRSWHQVQDYARALQVSANHLTTLTNAHLGQTPHAAIAERLVLEARRDLRFGSGTVTEVAYALGFSDSSNFSRFFRRHVGVAPRAYRRLAD